MASFWRLLAVLALLAPGRVHGHGGEEHQERHKGGRWDRVAVIMVKFGALDDAPPSREEARKVILEESVRYFKTISYGKETLSGDVFPRMPRGGVGGAIGRVVGGLFGKSDPGSSKDYYTLDVDIGKNCDQFGDKLTSILDAAVAAADPDVDFKNYGRLVLVFPKCGAGWGTTWEQDVRTDDGTLKFTISWIRELTMRVVPHELGHNMFLQHASSYYCRGGFLTSDCVDDEYGDRADSMGGAGPRHFNVYEKHQAGWIDDGQLRQVPNRTGVYRYEITPLELKGGLKGIRIPMSGAALDTDAPAKEFILELRTSIEGDYDEDLSERFLNGALVHIPMKTSHYDGQSPFMHTHVVDMDLSGDDLVLRPGGVWKSPNEYVKIKVGAIKDGKLPIQVVIGKPGLAQFLERAGKGVSDFIGGLLGRGKNDAAEEPAPEALGMRAAGLPRSVHRNSKEHEPDTTRMAGLEEAYALGLAPIPSVGAAPADLCSRISRIRRLPSPLKERFNDEAAARGLPATGIPCLSNGEVLAHKLAYERLGAGDADGAKEAFTWEGLAALKAERAALAEER